MKIASWNVNSIKARLEHVKRWLTTHQPDLLLLQELKGLDFPTSEFEALGYHAHTVTQKAYNGVAILSKAPQKMILNQLPGDEKDEQARYLEIDYPPLTPPQAGGIEGGSFRVINIYLPNGNPVNPTPSSRDLITGSPSAKKDPAVKPQDDGFSEKYTYKLSWMDRLYDRLKILRDDRIPFIIGGDFNVIPHDKDCHDPKAWEGDALFRPESRAKFCALLNLGLTDAFRVNNNQAGDYTFWDYQAGAWPQNKGIRIDHFLLSPTLTDRLQSCVIDKNPRGEEKASDHTPIILELLP